LRCEINEINRVWNKDELPQQWNESVRVTVYAKDDEIGCSNYRGISLLPTA